MGKCCNYKRNRYIGHDELSTNYKVIDIWLTHDIKLRLEGPDSTFEQVNEMVRSKNMKINGNNILEATLSNTNPIPKYQFFFF